MLTKRRRQRKQQKKKEIGLISKKTTLHVQHTFFVHFFAVVLHDYNVKLPETSQLHVLWRKCCMWSCSLFFAAALFQLGGRQHFSFSHSRYKIFMLFFKRNQSLLFFISGSGFFSVIHPMQTLKLSRKKESASSLLFFLSLKVRVAVRFTAETRVYLKCKISPRLT